MRVFPPLSLTLSLHEFQKHLNLTKRRRWGTNSLRIRIGLGGSAIVDKPGALIPPGDDNKGYPVLKTTSISHTTAATLGTFVNGNIQATVSADGMVTVFRVSDGAVVLREVARTYTQTTLHGNKAGPQSPPAPTWYIFPEIPFGLCLCASAEVPSRRMVCTPWSPRPFFG